MSIAVFNSLNLFYFLSNTQVDSFLFRPMDYNLFYVQLKEIEMIMKVLLE